MSNWNTFKDNMPPSGSGDVLKLEDGKPVKIRIIGEPYVFQSEYQGKPSTRFALSVWNQIDKKAQIIMLPKTPFGQIMGFATDEDWGDPELYDFTIIRSGTGKETEYSVRTAPNKAPLPNEQKQQVESIDVVTVLKRFPNVQFAMKLSEASQDTYKTSLGSEPQDTIYDPTHDELNAIGF